MIRRFVVVSAVGLALLCVPAVRAEENEALVFNDGLAAANAKLEAGGFEYGKVLGAAFILEAVDSALLKQKHNDLKKTFSEVSEKVAALKAPDSAEARALRKAHDRFLAGQKEMIEGDLTAIQKIIDDRTLDAAAKKLKIQGVLESMEQREGKAHRDLVAAQDAFAKKHNLRIEKDDE